MASPGCSLPQCPLVPALLPACELTNVQPHPCAAVPRLRWESGLPSAAPPQVIPTAAPCMRPWLPLLRRTGGCKRLARTLPLLDSADSPRLQEPHRPHRQPLQCPGVHNRALMRLRRVRPEVSEAVSVRRTCAEDVSDKGGTVARSLCLFSSPHYLSAGLTASPPPSPLYTTSTRSTRACFSSRPVS